MKEKNELLDLKSDWVFKRIFAKEENEDILASLISAIINEKITSVELRNTELYKNSEKEKLGILDIKAILNDNSVVDVEMQVKNEGNIIERDIYYLTKLYSEQLKNREDYKTAKKVIIINLLGYNCFKSNTPYHKISLKESSNTKNMYVKLYEVEEVFYTDKIQIYIVEIPKYLMLEHKENPSELDLWIWLFSGKKELIEMALSKGAQAIQRAYKQLEYLSQDEKARQEYDDYVQAKFDNSMMMHFEKEKGIEEGIEKGIEKGKVIGIEEGEKKKEIKIVKNMLKSNLSIETIMEVTGLTEEEIENIKNQMHVGELKKVQNLSI